MDNLATLRQQMVNKFQAVKWQLHPCGSGSLFENTKVTRNMLAAIASKYDIKTVSDAGCGDMSWVGAVDWDVEYTGYDLRQWHPDVVLFDITKDVLPQTDLIICRFVLNHLGSDVLFREVLARFAESRSKYIFITYTKDVFSQIWGDVLETRSQDMTGRAYNYGLWRLT